MATNNTGLKTWQKRIFFFFAYFWPVLMISLAYLNGRGHKRKSNDGWRQIIFGHMFYLVLICIFIMLGLPGEPIMQFLFPLYIAIAVLSCVVNVYIIFSSKMETLSNWFDETFNLLPISPSSDLPY